MGCLINVAVNAQIITVKQDGTGDFTIIQDAVDGSMNGDTILVYPGIYFENVDLTGKGVVLAGTWFMNHADSLVHQTIIDGNQNGSCIISESGNQLTEIIGFTLQHGNGTNIQEPWFPYLYGNGGGIYITESNFKISYCHFINNFAWHGGGIEARHSSIELAGNTIANNWAVGHGGGLRISSSLVVFDSVHLNNIYLNYSSSGSDVAIFYNDSISKIWLDTCTVINPDQYYIGKFSDWAFHIERPPISVVHGKIEQVNQDLYVSPAGDDNNSGLTPDYPLKTISFALLKIASDSLNLKTVHVADGVYSQSLTGEHPPLQLKNWVNIKGESRENTIIDCEKKYEGARFAFGQDYTYLKNLTFLYGNGYPVSLDGGLSSGYSKKLVLDSIAFLNTTGDDIAIIYSDSDDSLIIRNSVFTNSSGHYAVETFVKYYESPRYNEFISCTFSDNKIDSLSDISWEGRHVTLGILGSSYAPGWNKASIINCLFSNNIDSFDWTCCGGDVAVSAYQGSNISIFNSTFADNLTLNNPSGGAVGATRSSTVNFYNCILYGNYGCQAYLNDDAGDAADTMSVYYTLVQDGQEGIRDYGSYNQLIWGEGNLDSNPMFLGSEDYTYAIDIGSPCIDAGTLDLPPGIELPEYDLVGNPRVWGASVDMGAYEYGPWVSVPSAPNSKFQIPNSTSLSISPNPFTYGTYVSYELVKNGRLDISVYSLSGMKVRTLAANQGSTGDKGDFYWDGSDQNGNDLPAGVYLIRMTIDGKEVETVKVVRD